MASGGTGRVVVVAGGRVVVDTPSPSPPASGTVVVVGTNVEVGVGVGVGVGSTVVVVDDDSMVVAGAVVAGTVVAGTVVAGTVVVFVDTTEVVEVGRMVVVGGGAGRASTSTRCPWGKTCRSTSVTAALATYVTPTVATTQSDTTKSLRMNHQYRHYVRPVPSSVERPVPSSVERMVSDRGQTPRRALDG